MKAKDHLSRSLVSLVAVMVASVVSSRAAAAEPPPCGQPALVGGCALFAGDNVWNVAIDDLPASDKSEAYVTSIGADVGLHADFGSGTWAGGPIGIPFCIVGGDQPLVDVTFYYSDESDPGPYPVPTAAPIEGGSDSDGDRHVLVLDSDNCLLYELYDAHPRVDGSWDAGSGAVFDLSSDTLRPQGWTSADAAGLPILPGLVRYDEVQSGEIRHALRFTAPETQKAYVWPARHYASHLTDPDLPPMGQRFRLRSDFDLTGYSFETRVILTAMKRHGIILADNGASWFISGVPDERWDNDVLRELRTVHGVDFEAVDSASVMVHVDSGRAACSPAGPQIRYLPLIVKAG